jgi:ABC-type branched-subunit amino acid transport system permease subunit
LPSVVTSFLQLNAIWIMLAWSLALVYRVGQLYVGSAVAMLLAAYISGYLARDVGLPFSLALVVAVICGGVLGLLQLSL